MHLDVRILLVILEADIVLGPVAFDQLIFQDQRFQLGVGDHPLQVCDVRDQAPGLGAVLALLLEVGAHAVAQIHCLAHVDDAALVVAIDVAAGPGGQGLQFGFQLGG